MTENQLLVLFWLISIGARVPRIVERWRAPLLRGAGWFFNVAVAPRFPEEGGRGILASYRLRLFLPLAVEIPLCLFLLLTGRQKIILLLVMILTLLTRVAYYANRKMAEDAARRFQCPCDGPPVVSVMLSLQTRSVRDYSNPWIESAIAGVLLASLAVLGARYAASGDWRPMRGPWAVTLLSIYLQFGLLLMKRGFVRARSVAPAENTEQYLAWRESLRRLSTTVCDYIRLMLLFPPLTVNLLVLSQWNDARIRTLTQVSTLVLTAVMSWLEWRKRQQHLEVARQTRPGEFLVRPDTNSLPGLLCFRPSLPMLLRGPNGYALNLASAPVRTGGLYVAGCALLLIGLTR